MLKRLSDFIREDWRQNESVKNEMLLLNMHRMVLMGCATLFVHCLFILMFSYGFSAGSETEEAWRRDIIIIHSINALAVLAVTGATIYLDRKKTNFGLMLVVQYIFMADILLAGIALVTVDQQVTTNITPFLIVCTIIGFFIIKRPLASIVIFVAAFGAFFYMIGMFEKDAAILMTNRTNGLTFCCIGICLSLILWYAFRTSIMQARKIREQQDELQQLAFYDNLTGLLNRRRWMAILKDEIERLNRYGLECGLILMDIDHFKAINDKFGHPAGDKVLEEIAYILKKELRVTDKVARWGGEEFIILLPETSVPNTIASAEKIRKSIEELQVRFDDKSVGVTASFGVARIMRREDFAVSYNRADEALYLAKRMGRNQVRSMESHNLRDDMPVGKTTA